MEPRIHAITLAVSDLTRALEFYRDGLGLATEGVIGAEFLDDRSHASGAVVMFRLDGGLILALYPGDDLAKDANIPVGPPGVGRFSIGHAVPSREAVNEVLTQAERAGATVTEPPRDRPWGIYSGYFRDLDGHLWEIMWNPQLDA